MNSASLAIFAILLTATATVNGAAEDPEEYQHGPDSLSR